MDNTIINIIWSATLLVLAMACVALYYKFWRKKNSVSFIKYVENNLIKTVISIMVCGFLFYFWAYWMDYDSDGWEYNNTGNLIVVVSKAFVSALGMFVSTSDIVDLKSELRHNIFFMTPFTIVHLSALFISIMVVLKVLGYKLSSFVKMRFQQPSAKTHIFWGINENSLMLAESIKKKENECATIIFVELPCADKYDYNPITELFNKHNIQRSYISRMEGIEAYLIKAQYAFHGLNVDGECKQSEIKNIYSALGLDRLAQFISNAVEVQFYFLSETEQENLDNLMDIIRFYGIGSFNDIPVKKIYCHARRNSLNSIIGRTSEKIQFADSSYLSVLQLLKQAEYQPVNFVDIDTSKAIVTSEFNALVIGFGETGRDAFNFLYEFSTFLGPDGALAPRTINVIDEKMSLLKPEFLNNCPALDGKKEINWWNDMSVYSKEFWNEYKKLINKLNYIVITIDDDKKASDLAVKMYQLAYRYRKDMHNFKIFVRLKETDSAQLLSHITEYYKDKSNREDNGTNSLVSFGTYRTLFDAEIFDTDIEDQSADAFSKQYSAIYQQISEVLKEESAPSAVLLAKDIKDLTYKQQDISNVRHVDTKLILSGAVIREKNHKVYCDIKRMAELRSISERVGFEYPNARRGTPDFVLMENLSLCEHLRWNSKLELLGFVQSKINPDVKYTEKNFVFKTHECLVSCQELNTVPKLQSVKIYDWAIVELSFRYRLPKVQEPNK